MKRRCGWAKSDLSIIYHDNEWGVPLQDDRALFEFLILQGMQAGLSWKMILERRGNYRAAFDVFDPRAVAAYDREKVGRLLADPGIIHNRLKINAAIKNARSFLAVQEEFGGFDCYVWRFVRYEPVISKWRSQEEVPSRTPESEALSKDLAGRGFSFVGPTICYSFMQSVGMVNDHIISCFRHEEVGSSDLKLLASD